MAGIYISNMEMPQRDEVITIYPDGTAHRRYLGLRLHISESKAVPVPEHGRSIDADAIIQRIPIVSYEIYENIRALIDSAPTIIPADPEKEDQI